MLGTVEHIAGGLVNWNGAAPEACIGALTGMQR